jgi:hypothetical protein
MGNRWLGAGGQVARQNGRVARSTHSTHSTGPPVHPVLYGFGINGKRAPPNRDARCSPTETQPTLNYKNRALNSSASNAPAYLSAEVKGAR